MTFIITCLVKNAQDNINFYFNTFHHVNFKLSDQFESKKKQNNEKQLIGLRLSLILPFFFHTFPIYSPTTLSLTPNSNCYTQPNLPPIGIEWYHSITYSLISS